MQMQMQPGGKTASKRRYAQVKIWRARVAKMQAHAKVETIEGLHSQTVRVV